MRILDEIKSEDINKIAYCYKNKNITYGDLDKYSEAIACYLVKALGDNKAPVIIYGHKSEWMIKSFIAASKSGRAYVPIDVSISNERLKDIIEVVNPKLIITTEDIEINIDGISFINKKDLENIEKEYNGEKLDTDLEVKGEETYYIIFTSGSTGKPKGVEVTANNLESFVMWGSEICYLDKQNIFMNQAPFSFDLSVMDLYIGLYTRSTIFAIDKEMIGNMKLLFDELKVSNITHWVSTPSFVELCLSSKYFNHELLPTLKQALFCGEVLSNETAKNLKSRFNNLVITNTYGPTEATVAITSIDIDEKYLELSEALPVGKVKNHCEIQILNNGNQAKDGEKGEIVIIGDSVAKGYLNNLDMTTKNFTTIYGKRAYKTGDEGYLKDNVLYYSGRIDFQIKLNGYRIEIEDIENNIKKCTIIRNSAILPILSGEKISYLVGVVTLKESIPEREAIKKIREELKEYIPAYMIPRKFIVRNNLCMNANGKVDRKRLMEEYINDSL